MYVFYKKLKYSADNSKNKIFLKDMNMLSKKHGILICLCMIYLFKKMTIASFRKKKKRQLLHSEEAIQISKVSH